MESDQQIALVTGATRGIGRFLSEKLVEAGMTVVGCGTSADDGFSDGVHYFKMDVTDEDQVRSVVSRVRKQFGRLDLLINCAGVATMNHLMLTPTKSARKVLDINFLGTFIVTREASRLLSRSGGGAIVNLSSVVVPLRMEGEAVYAASKAAVEMFTKISAKELAAMKITCNAVGPGPVKTDLIAGVPDAKMQQLVSQLTPSRYVEMDEVWAAVRPFTGLAGESTTGQIVYVGAVG
jgi:3-oxoacyl-[acyl-carrier protein] reductase